MGLPAEVETNSHDERHRVVAHAVGRRYALMPFRQPASTRQAIDPTEGKAADDGDTIPVIVVQRMTDQLRIQLDDRHIAWVAEDGAGRVVIDPGLYVAREPSTGPAAVESESTLSWSKSAGAVAEALLSRHSGFRTRSSPTNAHAIPPLESLAAQTGVSPGQVSRVLASFDSLGWTTKSGAARGPLAQRTVEDPAAMLSSWSAWHAGRRFATLRGHAIVRDTSRFIAERLVPKLPPGSWCLTGFAAAATVAPFTTSIPSVACYVDRHRLDVDWTRLLDLADLRRVTTGEAVLFIDAEPHVMLQADTSGRDAPTASTPRIYADLLAAGMRGEETAAHLREVVLGY
jgi:hypothetical protein